MYACAGGHVECSGVLLDYGAQASIKSDADLDTPLHKAVREGHIEIVRLLLTRATKIDLEAPNIAGLTPGQLAERCKRPDIAQLLGKHVTFFFLSPSGLMLVLTLWILRTSVSHIKDRQSVYFAHAYKCKCVRTRAKVHEFLTAR